jgi:hypothetical protein
MLLIFTLAVLHVIKYKYVEPALAALKPAYEFRIFIFCAFAHAGHFLTFGRLHGEMPEWLNGTVSKTVVWATVPRVRIPLSPPPPAEARRAQAGFFVRTRYLSASYGGRSPLFLTRRTSKSAGNQTRED